MDINSEKTNSWLNDHKIFLIVFAIILLASAFYFFFLRNSQDEVSETMLQIEEVTKGDIEIVVTGTGQIEAESQVDLKPVVAGDAIEVMEVYVENDQEVKEDEIIALLDSEDAWKSIRDAEADLRSAQVRMAEIEKQYDNQTEDDRWARQTQEIVIQQRQNSLNDAKEKLEDYYIKAPFDGIVTDLSVSAGDSISQTDILASVITEDLIASVTLNEVDAVKVEIGNDVSLTFDALPELEVQGEVSKVDTIGEVQSGVVSYEVEIKFSSSNEYLKPGMSVNAEIEIESVKDVAVISSSSIESDKNGNYVMVFSGSDTYQSLRRNLKQLSVDQFERREIETGISDDVQAEITSGLSEGEVILTASFSSSSQGSNSSSRSQESQGLLDFGGGAKRGKGNGSPR